MATVRIQDDGRTFPAEGRETLLEAAIRAGVSLPYGCSAGNCGLCRARLVAGELAAVRHHDFAFSAAERAQGCFLLCSRTAAGDVVLALDDPAAAEIPLQRLQAKVRSMELHGPDLMRLRLRPPRAARLRFLAGQYARLRLGGAEAEAAIASCPCEERHLDFHLRRRGGDAFSDAVFGGLRPGAAVELEAPLGRFTFDEASPRPAAFVAFDTGFAAVQSILEHVTARESARPLRLFRVCCARADLYLDNLCRAWADALDELTYMPLALAEDFAEWAADPAGLDRLEALLARIVDALGDLSGHDLYVCAPAAVVERFEKLARERGLARGQFHAEVVRGYARAPCLGVGA